MGDASRNKGIKVEQGMTIEPPQPSPKFNLALTSSEALQVTNEHLCAL
jgi:hypothetical protein